MPRKQHHQHRHGDNATKHRHGNNATSTAMENSLNAMASVKAVTQIQHPGQLLASTPASIPSSSPTRIPPPPEQLPLPVFPSHATGPHDPPPSGETDPMCRPAKKAAKLVKATHIMSKQRRRNFIQGGFGILSGISIATPDPPPPGSSATPMSELNNTKKPKTCGRGRRGKIKTGASNFVILKRAAEFVVWMANYNSALSSEISCLKNILLSHHIQV
ncbi:hypothetical protein PTTG_29195 [Puccinia triticina 1-1 BBBD Race 1]|uniref:BHLH domain-containing protein n=1 Tax=Puccinia triticina (isolate 1-1 / race 1 (BBBD)) TaxID=630390 RepID=A0A180G5R7_PUCT1|nr:hypothetical protein PTTG_29195 [Puccinia triticina 1-1 BBBD Race 1]